LVTAHRGALSWVLGEGYETNFSPTGQAQQLGEIAVGLLAICLLRILASRAMKLQFIRVSPHLLTSALLLFSWKSLEHHVWSLEENKGGYDPQTVATFAHLQAGSALSFGLTIGVLCLLGSIFLVIWNRRRNRIAAQIARAIR
jgi:hypothetical protein